MKARQLAADRGHADVAMLLDQAEALGRRLLQAANEGHDISSARCSRWVRRSTCLTSAARPR